MSYPSEWMSKAWNEGLEILKELAKDLTLVFNDASSVLVLWIQWLFRVWI